MSRIKPLVVAIGALHLGLLSAGAWWLSHRSPPSENTPEPSEETSPDLLGVWGASDGERYAVGAHGLLLHSEDRGAHWRRLPSPGDEAEELRGVWGSDPDNVYVVGDRIHHSSDHGQTWEERAWRGEAHWDGVWGRGRDELYVWTNGAGEGEGMLIASSDGGHAWKRVATGEWSSIYDVWGFGRDLFFDAANPELVDYTDYVRSSDHGNQWIKTELHLPGEAPFAAGSSALFVISGSTIYKSEDRGDTWRVRYRCVQLCEDLKAGWSDGHGNVLLVAAKGQILSSKDDGRSFDMETVNWLDVPIGKQR
jgi:photosystem II stability/assembly factor-like uncharacterized protein